MLNKLLLSTALTLLIFTANSQNVGINSTGNAPDASAGLDVDFNNKGVLIPRVALTAINTAGPISSPTTSLLVYNTATTTGTNAVTPGYYYWYSGKWVRLSSSENNWRIDGNDNITSTNFLGTTNNQYLALRTNNTERMRILAAGNVVIHGTTSVGNAWLNIRSAGANFGVYSDATSGEAYRGEATTGDGFVGISTSGNGVYGLASNANGRGGIFINANTNGNALLASGGDSPIYSFANSGTGGAFTGRKYGVSSIAVDAYGTGIISGGNNLTTLNSYPDGSGIAGTGRFVGVYGYANIGILDDGVGGYFGSEYSGLAVVGGWMPNQTKIMGNGTVSTVVKNLDEDPVVMFAPEAPEVLFQDFGVGQLANGKARIDLDPILSKNIVVNETHPIKIFIQLEGKCKGVYVTDKSDKGFTVIEQEDGQSNTAFSWQIVATRANELYEGSKGDFRLSDYSKRFPPAPEDFKKVRVRVVKDKAEELSNDIQIKTPMNNTEK